MLIKILNWYNQGNNLHKLGYGAPITMAIYLYTYNWNSTPKWRVYPIFSYSTSFFCKGSANHQLLRLEKVGRHMAMYGTLHCVREMLKHHEFVSLQISGFWKKLAAIRTICWAIYAWNPRYHGTVERGHDVRMGLESGASWFQTNLITNLGLMVMSIQHCTTILNGGYKLPKLGGTGAPSRISDLVNSSVWRLLAWSLFNYDNYKVVPPSIRKFWLLVYVHSSFHPINWIQLAWSCFIYTVLVVYVSHKPNSLSVGHQWHHLAMQQSQAKNGFLFSCSQ